MTSTVSKVWTSHKCNQDINIQNMKIIFLLYNISCFGLFTPSFTSSLTGSSVGISFAFCSSAGSCSCSSAVAAFSWLSTKSLKESRSLFPLYCSVYKNTQNRHHHLCHYNKYFCVWTSRTQHIMHIVKLKTVLTEAKCWLIIISHINHCLAGIFNGSCVEIISWLLSEEHATFPPYLFTQLIIPVWCNVMEVVIVCINRRCEGETTWQTQWQQVKRRQAEVKSELCMQRSLKNWWLLQVQNFFCTFCPL